MSGIALLFAVQNPTNTQSNASGCNNKPTLSYINSSDSKYRSSVDYHLTLRDNCYGTNKYIVKVVKTPTEPRLFNSKWGWRFANSTDWFDPITKNTADTGEMRLTVTRPGAYLGPGYGEAMTPGKYRYVVVKASLVSNPDVYDTLSLIYTAD